MCGYRLAWSCLHCPVCIAGDVFEEYCALAEYIAEDSSQISFKSGDKVLVMSKDESGEPEACYLYSC